VKRTIHILFWLSLVTALLVFLFRRGERQQAPTETQPSSVGGVTVLAHTRLPPPKLVRPDAGPARAAEPEISAEAALMKQIRDHYRTDPAKAVEAAREARERFGDSRDSDERDGLLVQAYLNLHDTAAARAEMPYYYQHHPHGRWADYLFALTNVGPNAPP
jgi:hypothetical protein